MRQPVCVLVIAALVFALASCSSPTGCHTGISPEVEPDSVVVAAGETFIAGAGDKGCDYRRPTEGFWRSQDSSIVRVVDSVFQKSREMTIGRFRGVRVGSTHICVEGGPGADGVSCVEDFHSVPVRVTDE